MNEKQKIGMEAQGNEAREKGTREVGGERGGGGGLVEEPWELEGEWWEGGFVIVIVIVSVFVTVSVSVAIDIW